MNNGKNNNKSWLLPLVVAALLLAVVLNVSSVLNVFDAVLSAINPILLGLSFAFVMNVPMSFFENKAYAFMSKGRTGFLNSLRRPLALVTTIMLFTGVIAFILYILIPELTRMTQVIIDNLPYVANNIISWSQGVLLSLGIPSETVENLRVDWGAFINNVLTLLQSGGAASAATSFTTSIIQGITSFIMAFVIAVYTLLQKERIFRFTRRACDAYLSERTNKRLLKISQLCVSAFSGFIRSQFFNALIQGVLCYIGMLIFGFHYAPLVSVIFSVFSLIPIAGPIIGGIIGALLILMVSPLEALLFLVFLILLQQILGNIIYPKLVGKSTGLPGVLVLSAFIIGGSLYGVAGTIISIPLTAVLYTVVKELIEIRLKKKSASAEE